jgi:hypothetical protein
MTWGCQLWFRQGGTKGLVKNLQQVQNEMVKVVTGSFHTAPRETLLQITRMLPMHHFLEKTHIHIRSETLQVTASIPTAPKAGTIMVPNGSRQLADTGSMNRTWQPPDTAARRG